MLVSKKCPACRGKGEIVTGKFICYTCGGSGRGGLGLMGICSTCQGEGWVEHKSPCLNCRGSGNIWVDDNTAVLW